VRKGVFAGGPTYRGGGIRTHDPLLPKQVRYQAALRPDSDELTGTDRRSGAHGTAPAATWGSAEQL